LNFGGREFRLGLTVGQFSFAEPKLPGLLDPNKRVEDLAKIFKMTGKLKQSKKSLYREQIFSGMT
jgi:hypothetical protein